MTTSSTDSDRFSFSDTTQKERAAKEVRVLSDVEAGGFTEIDNFAGIEGFELVGVTVEVRKRTFALRVRGDSMIGTTGDSFPEGTIIVVEPELKPEPGDYVVAFNEKNEGTFKQLRSFEGELYLHPLNQLFDALPLGDSTLIGVVREAIQRFR